MQVIRQFLTDILHAEPLSYEVGRRPCHPVIFDGLAVFGVGQEPLPGLPTDGGFKLRRYEVTRIVEACAHWPQRIADSFLSDMMKDRYLALLAERQNLLGI